MVLKYSKRLVMLHTQWVIRTLIGLVQMLFAMDDPKSIGPAMAVALLTTLYGVVVANAMALPMADRLKKAALGRSSVKILF